MQFARRAVSSSSIIQRVMLVALVSFVLWPAIDAAAQEEQAAPALLSFDEIGRVHIKPPAPPADSFAADAARISSLPALPSSKSVYNAFQAIHALGMNPLTAFAVAPAAIAANAAVKVNQAQVAEFSQQILNAGIMTHVWVHRDWTRIEIPTLRSASITRPDLRAAYFLDLTNRTFREIRTAVPAGQDEDTYVVSASDDVIVTFDRAPVHSSLGTMTLGNLTARGYRTEASFTLSGLIGWCSSGRHTLVEVEYVTDLADPQAPPGPAIEGSNWARDVCMPANAASHREPGHLVLFRSSAFTGGTASEDFVNVFERGNLRTAERTDMSLFTVPTNFTKVEQK